MLANVANWLIGGGLVLLALGLLAKFGLLGWFGHLPGDLHIERGNARVFFPLTSMIVVSVVLTILVNLLRR